MDHTFDRTAMLLGPEAMERLGGSTVAVFGLGGVGGSAAETLARSGVWKLKIIDMDFISESNINRQIIATRSTIGRKKTEVMKERLLEINPEIGIEIYDMFILEDNIEVVLGDGADYVLDCIDTVTAKINLAVYCYGKGIPLISSMGAGNKLDPTRLEITDIYSTSVCPLAKVMRRELKVRGIPSMDVIYSREPAMDPMDLEEKEDPTLVRKRKTPGSVAFVPPVAGIIMAGYVIRRLAGKE